MKNAVGRDIPEELLVNGKEVYQGKNYMDGKYLQKAAPRTRRYEKPQESKIVETLADALRQCGAKDGMTFSFHHHLRNGDYVVNMVMKAAIEELGLKDLTIAATSLGEAHDPIAEYIEEGKVIGIQTSGIRGRMGQVVSEGKLKTPAIIRSHGGRPRAIEAGEVHIDIAFVAAPTSDCVGNCRGIGGKSNCGSMGYAMTDAKYADHVVVVTDCLVDFPNMPASVEAIDVDAVVVVDSIGNPKKIASAAARISQNPRDLMMAERRGEGHRFHAVLQGGLLLPDGRRRPESGCKPVPGKIHGRARHQDGLGHRRHLRPDGGAAQEGQGRQGHRCAGL